MAGSVIRVTGVARHFRVVQGRRTLFRVLGGLLGGVREPPVIRKALSDVTFEMARGERMALIGNNGAGKSTLLKIVAGLLRPTAGTVSVSGEMALITALGAGMIDELSVVDNALLYGALYGVPPARMRAALPDILAWAEIPDYAHARLKTLSTGTRARLGFSVVRYVAAEILLIDEALSAGDATFRAKCRAFFDEPRNHDATFLVATHDMDFATSFCSRALWLHEGRVAALGESSDVVARYLEAQPGSRPRQTPAAAVR